METDCDRKQFIQPISDTYLKKEMNCLLEEPIFLHLLYEEPGQIAWMKPLTLES